MILDPKPKSGLKKDDETHSRKKIKKKKKKPDDDDPGGDEDVVTDKLDISVNWDPWKQKWISTILVRIKIPFGEPETVVFERESDLYPDDMDVPNTVNDTSGIPTDDSYFQDVDSPLPSMESSYTDGVTVFGHALGTDLIPTAKESIYGWKSNAYMLQSFAKKNVAVAFEGALLSGAQLNVITGSHVYDTSQLYEISKCKYVDYLLNGDFTESDPEFTNIKDFVNRNKGVPGKQSEWTPANVRVDLEVLVTTSEDRSKFFESVFMTSMEDQILQSVVSDPDNWRIVNNYNEGVAAEMFNNYQRYGDLKSMPYSLRLMAASSLTGSIHSRIDWLQTLNSK